MLTHIGDLELCTRVEPCDWSAGAHGVTTMLGVSLRACLNEYLVMLGVSLRARWDTTLVELTMCVAVCACVWQPTHRTADVKVTKIAGYVRVRILMNR